VTEEELIADAQVLGRWEQHRFMVLVGLTIVVALILVMISLQLYNSSGVAQLDLSRPGYKSVRKEASHSNDFTSFPSTGPLDQDALDNFRKLYDDQVKEATTVDSFGGDVMSDTALGLDVPPAQ
jgi:hypothetical protein